jgi:hypothetical protein
VQFKKIEKWNIYETWQHKDRRTGIVSYIRKMPKNFKNNEYYHFQISSANSKKYDIRYDSIDDLQIFNTFDETKDAVKNW